MTNIILLLISLIIILISAEIFVNGIEWLGKKLKLGEGAVGSILAAVGTALPESLIPVIAIVFGSEEAGHEIGIGAILGAPFMLSTLAMFISAVAVIAYRQRRPDFPIMRVNVAVMSRDLLFFLIVYSVAILTAFLGAHEYKVVVAIFLVFAYILYVLLTLKRGGDEGGEEDELKPLLFAKASKDPVLMIILLQIGVALGGIILGAHTFVEEVTVLAFRYGIPAFILSLIIAPIASELPEKFNSVIWIGKGKDTLALGNITGAMVFQSSIIPAIGILLTDWVLTPGAMLSAALAITSGLIIYIQIKARHHLTPYILASGGLFYIVFIVFVLAGVIR